MIDMDTFSNISSMAGSLHDTSLTLIEISETLKEINKSLIIIRSKNNLS
jgi:hypothetical protein